MFFTKKKQEQLNDDIKRLTEKSAYLENRIIDTGRTTAEILKEHTEYLKIDADNLEAVRRGNDLKLEETEKRLNGKIDGSQEVMENMVMSLDCSLSETIRLENEKTDKKIENLSRNDELLKDNLLGELAGMENRMTAKMTEMVSRTNQDLQELMAKKIRQLEIFKEGEELLGDNAIGFAVINEMVKRAFRKEHELIEKTTQELDNRARMINVEQLKLNNLKFMGSITNEQFNREFDELNEVYLENSRRSTSDNDDFDIRAKNAKHTIDFLTKWKNKKD